MTAPSLADAARALLADPEARAPLSTRIAARAVEACERLSRHLARLLGEMGIRALFHRSMILTRARFPWFGNVAGTAGRQPGESPWAALRASMELQDPDTAVNGYADFLSTFVQILGRLIGEPLVSRVLQEVWPEVFPRAAKEPT